MDWSSIEKLVDHFNSRIEAVNITLAARDVNELPSNILQQVDCLELTLRSIKTEIRNLRELLDQEVIQSCKISLESLVREALHLVVNKPHIQHPEATNTAPPEASALKEVCTNETVVLSKQPVKARSSPCPMVQSLSQEDLDDIPKYMRGRITLEQLNKLIEDINLAVKGKWAIIKKPVKKLSWQDRTELDVYKQQITKDTQGLFFVMEDDIRKFACRKMDKATTNMLTVLRHLRLLREVRSGKTIRFVTGSL